MNKFLTFFLGLFLFFSSPLAAFAQFGIGQELPRVNPASRLMIPPAPPTQASLPFGQNHYYTVTLRGNGEAFVALKTVFSNPGSASLSAMKLTFPNAPANLSVYQVQREPQCLTYKPYPIPLDAKPGAPLVDSMIKQPDCAEYQEPDYQYGFGNTSYQKAQVTLDGNSAIITLPKAVKPGGSGSLVVSFAASGDVKKDFFGAYHFTFQTVKVADSVQNLQVGISTDPEFYLKDAGGTINYHSREMGVSMSMAAPLAADSVKSAQFDQFYNQIGYGTIQKSVTNLQPNESYSVTGTYSNNKAALYGKELSIGIGVVVIFLLLAGGSLFLGVKKVYGKAKKAQSENAPVKGKYGSILAVLGVSFGSSLFITLYTIGIYAFSYYFLQMFQSYSYSGLYPMMFILLGLISLSIYALFLFVPGIIIGVKKGILAGILTVILTTFWLVVHGIIFAFLFFLVFQNKYQPEYSVQPVNIMRSDAGAAGSAVESAPELKK